MVYKEENQPKETQECVRLSGRQRQTTQFDHLKKVMETQLTIKTMMFKISGLSMLTHFHKATA